MFNRKHARRWLLAAFAVETLCATYFLSTDAYLPVVSVLYAAAGAGIVICMILLPQATPVRLAYRPRKTFAGLVPPVLIIVMLILAFIVSRYWFDLIPIDPDYADMLPIIKVMDQRFLGGQWHHVYDSIPEIWNGTRPVYLPAMWLPFAPAVFFNFDMRWISVACLLAVFIFFLLALDLEKHKINSLLALCIAALLFWWLFAANDAHGFLSMSEEAVVAFYYSCLVAALFSGNIVLIGIAASLCMLSRYALIGWVPAFLLYLLLKKKNKSAAIFALTGAVCLLLLFILPFGTKTLIRLSTLPGNYIAFSKIVWKNSPEVFRLSLGFAKFFGPGRTVLLHTVLLLSSFSIPVWFAGYCAMHGRKKRLANIPLATLKLSVLLFYSFIDVPYLYLFYTSSFISLIAVAFLLCPDITATNNR